MKVNSRQLREVAAECRANGPKLEAAIAEEMVKPLQKLYDETSVESFNTLHEKSKDAKAKVYTPIAEAFIEVANILDELADRADAVSNSVNA